MTVEEAYADFHQRMQTLGQRITESDFPDDPRMRAEGYRYLTRLQGFAVQWYLEYSDPVRPAFFRFGDEVYKWAALNADNHYVRARVEPSGRYRIYGNVGQAAEVLISTHDGEMVFGQTALLAERSLSELKVGEDGSVEVFLGGPEQDHNWMPLDETAQIVLIRQYIADWEHDELPDLRIERIDDDAATPPPVLTPEAVATALDQAATWVERSTTYWNDYTLAMIDGLGTNVMTPPHRFEGGVGANNMAAGVCWWELGPDEAMIIETEVPEAPYWSIQLTGPTWFEGPDFANRVTSLNGTQTHVDDDGRIRIVLSHQDPGVQNWLDTTGYPIGMVGYRWVRPITTPTPTVTVVRFNEVMDHLPESTRRYSTAERAHQIRRRRSGIARRFRR
jgi:hypothetical protein